MAELPERKVLKEILAKLKTKTLSSQETVSKSVTSMIRLTEAIDEMTEGEFKDTKVKEMVIVMRRTINILKISVFDLVNTFFSTLDDMNLYTESLEKYSGELDKTLNEIFEQARKQAEEQIKKQRELMKRRDESYTV